MNNGHTKNTISETVQNCLRILGGGQVLTVKTEERKPFPHRPYDHGNRHRKSIGSEGTWGFPQS